MTDIYIFSAIGILAWIFVYLVLKRAIRAFMRFIRVLKGGPE